MTGNFLGHDRGYAPDPKTIEVEAPIRVLGEVILEIHADGTYSTVINGVNPGYADTLEAERLRTSEQIEADKRDRLRRRQDGESAEQAHDRIQALLGHKVAPQFVKVESGDLLP